MVKKLKIEVTSARNLITLEKRLRRNKVFHLVIKIKTLKKSTKTDLGIYKIWFKKGGKK